MEIFSLGKIPIKAWIKDIEEGAMKQALNLANLPFAFKHIAIMPDAHQGYGMPIGGVMATHGVIIPNAVGVDIGCGMCAIKTSLKDINKEMLKKIMGRIRKVIPVGFKKHAEEQDTALMPFTEAEIVMREESDNYPIVLRTYSNWKTALRSLGTLGGGNHFIEIQKGSDGFIWIMIHSGSRNLGLQVAKHYNDLANKLNRRWESKIPESWELAFLPSDSKEGKLYIKEMQFCIDYALANRKLMMEKVIASIAKYIEFNTPEEMINIAHNYVQLENHFGKDVWVHRKGATKATKGLIGIIPGSQGSSSYIVEGLGNPESFNSCSHGAGRRMSRTKAKKELDLETEKKILDDQGIIHSIRNVGDLDEAPSAYKDIKDIMKQQTDLVKVKVELKPLAVIKG